MSRFVSFFRSTALWILILPSVCTFFGAASNQLVLWANNDTFPVKVNAVKMQKLTGGDAPTLPDGTVMLDEVHCLMTSKTHLNLLADNWDFHDAIYSVGDFILELGDWLAEFTPFVWGAIVIGRLRNAVH